MSLTAEEALRKAKQLMGPATSPKSTVQDRRDFYTHLITLPSYPNKECKTFFGTLVGKFFAEFEDLQDGAIDALLDLCEDEDEKMRIIGIRGLGPTGKADPRWVRGNTGVLLQLLASQPSELKFVRDALDILLSVSPADVFSVMADDCRNTEEDTGASRRNILEYLNYEFTQQRYDLLEKGQHPEVEEIFRTEFLSVMPLASASERRMLASWLLPLSTVSGANSTPKTRGEFLNMLRGLAPSQAMTAEMGGVLLMLRAFQEKVIKAGMTLDPRWPIAFVGGQAKGMVALALGTSYPAKRLLESLKECIAGAKIIWEKEEMEEFEELGSEVLITEFVKSVVSHLLAIIPYNRSSDYFYKHGVLYEQFLHAVYELVTFGRDRRKELISEAEAKVMADLVPVAETTKARVAQVPYLVKEAVSWGPIAKYFALLGNHAIPIEEVIPSWDAPPAPLAPTRTSTQNQNYSRASRVPVAVPLTGSAYMGAKPVGMGAGVLPGPNAMTPTSGPSYAPTAAPASGPSYAPTAPVVPFVPTASTVSTPSVRGPSAPSSRPARIGGSNAMDVDRPTTPPFPFSSASASRPKDARAGADADVRMASPPRSEKDEKRRKDDRRDKDKSNGHSHRPSSSGGREREREFSHPRDRDSRREPPQAVPAARAGLDVPPHHAGTVGKRLLADRIGGTATFSASLSAADPLAHAPAPAGPSAGEGAGGNGLSIMGGGKRQRAREEEDVDMERIKKNNGKGREGNTKEGAVASLMSRLGPRPSADDASASSSTSPAPAPSGLHALGTTSSTQALRNRFGQGIKGSAAGAGAGGADKSNASPSPFDRPAVPQSITILNRSKAVPSAPASTAAGARPLDDGRIASGGPVDDDGEGVVRKGRGFMREEEKVEVTAFEAPQRGSYYQNHQQQVLSQQQRSFQQGPGTPMRGGMNGFGTHRGRGNFGGLWGRQKY